MIDTNALKIRLEAAIKQSGIDTAMKDAAEEAKTSFEAVETSNLSKSVGQIVGGFKAIVADLQPKFEALEPTLAEITKEASEKLKRSLNNPSELETLLGKSVEDTEPLLNETVCHASPKALQQTLIQVAQATKTELQAVIEKVSPIAEKAVEKLAPANLPENPTFAELQEISVDVADEFAGVAKEVSAEFSTLMANPPGTNSLTGIVPDELGSIENSFGSIAQNFSNVLGNFVGKVSNLGTVSQLGQSVPSITPTQIAELEAVGAAIPNDLIQTSGATNIKQVVQRPNLVNATPSVVPTKVKPTTPTYEIFGSYEEWLFEISNINREITTLAFAWWKVANDKQLQVEDFESPNDFHLKFHYYIAKDGSVQRVTPIEQLGGPIPTWKNYTIHFLFEAHSEYSFAEKGYNPDQVGAAELAPVQYEVFDLIMQGAMRQWPGIQAVGYDDINIGKYLGPGFSVPDHVFNAYGIVDTLYNTKNKDGGILPQSRSSQASNEASTPVSEVDASRLAEIDARIAKLDDNIQKLDAGIKKLDEDFAAGGTKDPTGELYIQFQQGKASFQAEKNQLLAERKSISEKV